MQYLEKIGKNKIINEKSIYCIEKINNNNIYIMRDDLIPFSFGGNKARKAKYFFKEILENEYNYVITYGSASSNHCRIIANLAQRFNIKCTIISTEKEHETNNKIMCEIFKVEFVYCKVDEVKQTIKKQMNKKIQEGNKPYFIPGGGHGNLGTQSYIDAYQEINDYQEKNKIKFDYIFHASGTGTTQAGLIIGNILNGRRNKIIGISIARRKQRGKQVIIDSINEYKEEFIKELNLKEDDVIFDDSYILDGYGSYNEEILATIRELLIKEGIPLDTTYTGKAFWGMKEYLKKEKIENKNILFIHTGGTPIFFDILKELKK